MPMNEGHALRAVVLCAGISEEGRFEEGVVTVQEVPCGSLVGDLLSRNLHAPCDNAKLRWCKSPTATTWTEVNREVPITQDFQPVMLRNTLRGCLENAKY